MAVSPVVGIWIGVSAGLGLDPYNNVHNENDASVIDLLTLQSTIPIWKDLRKTHVRAVQVFIMQSGLQFQ